jgi:hypothetical protein
MNVIRGYPEALGQIADQAAYEVCTGYTTSKELAKLHSRSDASIPCSCRPFVFEFQLLVPDACVSGWWWMYRERNSLLALRVEVDTTDPTLDLIEADVIEPLKRRTLDTTQLVVWNKEVLFPAHEDVLLLPPGATINGMTEVHVGFGIR